MRIARSTLHWFKSQIEGFRAEVRSFANFPSMFLAMANDACEFSAYNGWLRFVDANLNVVADHIRGADYQDYIGEASNDDSYLKSTYFKPLGPAAGM